MSDHDTTISSTEVLADLTEAFTAQVPADDEGADETADELDSSHLDTSADAILSGMHLLGMQARELHPHDQDSLDEAMSVLRQFGSFNEKGFSPFLQRPIEDDIRALFNAANFSFSHCEFTVRKAACEIAADKSAVIRRHYICFDDSQDPAAMQIIFCAMPDGTRAASERNVVATAFAYWPSTYERPDGSIGAGYFNHKGMMGAIKEYAAPGSGALAYNDAMEDSQALDRALRTIRGISRRNAPALTPEEQEDVEAARGVVRYGRSNSVPAY